MSHRARMLAAWTLAAFAGACGVGAFVLFAATSIDNNYVVWGAVASLSFPIVGALVVTRQPGNRIAWIFIAIGVALSLSALSDVYASYGLSVAPGSLPGAVFVSWIESWVWAPGFGLFVSFALLWFPDGRPPSPRWRIVVPLATLSILAVMIDLAVFSWDLRGPAILGIGNQGSPLIAVWFAALLLSGVLSAASLVVRFRGSSGVQRQQLKWVAYAGAVTVAIVLPAAAMAQGTSPSLLAAAALPLVPAAAGIAIVRYRLYEIDRLISRTLVYGLVTAILAGVYVCGVVLIGALLRPLTAESQWSVAASTLGVAAAFGPVRRRVQSGVDRRFNRARYDAVRTVETFNAQLRDEVDLDSLADQLQMVAASTVQPAHVSLWLRHAGESS